jgi:hypothetical protein
VRRGKILEKMCGFIPLVQKSSLDEFIPLVSLNPLVQASRFENGKNSFAK